MIISAVMIWKAVTDKLSHILIGLFAMYQMQ